MKLINASLMCSGENGFTKQMRRIATDGYWELRPGTNHFNENLITMVDFYKPDLVFIQIQSPGILDEATVKNIGSKCVVFNFSGDIRVHLDQWYYDIGKHISCTFFNNMMDVMKLRELNIESNWMEMGFDPEIYKTYEGIPEHYDVVAHFNHYENSFPLTQYRMDIVNRLRMEFGDKFAVFGHFPGAFGNFNNDQVAEARNYNAARIAINCSHFCVDSYSSDRLLRILGTKTACVSHWFPNIDKMYDVSNDLYYFTDLDDMVIQCRLLLRDEEERKRIAENGQKAVLSNYTFKHMANNILSAYHHYKLQKL